MKIKEMIEILQDEDPERYFSFVIPMGNGYTACYDLASKAWEAPDGLRIQLGQNQDFVSKVSKNES